jgi:hypothetical protein
MKPQDPLVLNLAGALLNGVWSVPAMARRLAEALGRKERWFRSLARAAIASFGKEVPRPTATALAEWIGAGLRHQRGDIRYSCPHRLFWVMDAMAPARGAPASWNVPAITTPRRLANWLGVELAELDWFADGQHRLRRAPEGPLQHYTCRWHMSRRRNARLLEVPKARLKDIQRRLLHELLERIPPHMAAHGYRKGRSIVTMVAPHAGRSVVLHLDLRHFFASIGVARVRALFATAGYPPPVATMLAGLCTHAVAPDVLDCYPADARPLADNTRKALLLPHLPQGAPTSPALANLCAFRLDCRLAGLSGRVGANYTRYADDLVFSGGEEFARRLRRFHVHVCRIALEEGFEINTRKSHFMRQGVRQQVAGIVLNVRPNVERAEYDRLKAILTNCIRHGPANQNRDSHADFRAHLLGRIAYVRMINPMRGDRLRALFARIAWG